MLFDTWTTDQQIDVLEKDGIILSEAAGDRQIYHKLNFPFHIMLFILAYNTLRPQDL